MTKTIHDLAVAYGKEYQGTADIEVFEAGANAVLEEVEKVYQKEGAFGVIQLIKQLKEEL